MSYEVPVHVVEPLRDALSDLRPDDPLVVKKMFGGAGFYVDGVMFAGWFGRDTGVALKLPPDDVEELLSLGGQPTPMPGGSYVEIPDHMAADPRLLVPYVERSIEFAKAKKRRK
jgi:TfoX/Sxy family transcriptional regulator of competence genes